MEEQSEQEPEPLRPDVDRIVIQISQPYHFDSERNRLTFIGGLRMKMVEKR